jgi:hypothetical protein
MGTAERGGGEKKDEEKGRKKNYQTTNGHLYGQAVMIPAGEGIVGGEGGCGGGTKA